MGVLAALNRPARIIFSGETFDFLRLFSGEAEFWDAGEFLLRGFNLDGVAEDCGGDSECVPTFPDEILPPGG